MPTRFGSAVVFCIGTAFAVQSSLAQGQSAPTKPPEGHVSAVAPPNCQFDPGDHLLTKLWKRVAADLTLHPPNERQRLSDLRLKVEDLAEKKQSLINAINRAVAESSLQGWQQTSGRVIPGLQQEIADLTARVDEETRTGGLLAADADLSKLRDALFQKAEIVACELTAIPFPLSQNDTARLNKVLQLLSDEEQALKDFDGQLVKLIEQAKPEHAQAEKKTGN